MVKLNESGSGFLVVSVSDTIVLADVFTTCVLADVVTTVKIPKPIVAAKMIRFIMMIFLC